MMTAFETLFVRSVLLMITATCYCASSWIVRSTYPYDYRASDRNCMNGISRGGVIFLPNGSCFIFQKSPLVSRCCNGKQQTTMSNCKDQYCSSRCRMVKDYEEGSVDGSRTSLYGIPNASWKSKEWNWGYAVGTAHDCAKVCRDRYRDHRSRQQLIDRLQATDDEETNLVDWEEIKLIVGLMIQQLNRYEARNRPMVTAFNDIMISLIEAKRYESSDDNDHNESLAIVRFVKDLQMRYHLLLSTKQLTSEQPMTVMDEIVIQEEKETDHRQRIVIGFVLHAMGFVERGL